MSSDNICLQGQLLNSFFHVFFTVFFEYLEDFRLEKATVFLYNEHQYGDIELLGLVHRLEKPRHTQLEQHLIFVETVRVSVIWIHIAFHDIGCRIPQRQNAILEHVTGQIQPGKLTAILGQSGSGKSTFISLLLGRSRSICKPSLGTVYLNGRARTLESYLDRVGYVPQAILSILENTQSIKSN